MKNTIIARLEMIFSQTDIDRITVKDTVPKNLQVMVDVHGMKCCEAKKFINNIINAVRDGRPRGENRATVARYFRERLSSVFVNISQKINLKMLKSVQ